MAVSSKGGKTQIQMPKKLKDREISPERTKIWTESKPKTERKVAVVYYLSRSGSLEHPHFMEVSLSTTEGLYLRDFINRLNTLRGKGMASMYSWSSKRSYKNGFVWQDLSENDFIYPAQGQEYVLKGSELLEPPLNSSRSNETLSSTSSLERLPETQESGEDSDSPPVIVRRRNQSWSSIDLNEYKVYKAESIMDSAGKASDAATQTDDKRRRMIREDNDDGEYENLTTELTREEISPPPSSPSPETLETLIKAHRRVSTISEGESLDIHNRTVNNNHHQSSGRNKASAVLMQLISCGAISLKDSIADKETGFSLISYYKSRLPPARGGETRGGGESNRVVSNDLKDHVDCYLTENPSFSRIQLEDKEYFSGSLIETKKDEFSALKRSSSYNADRSSKLVLREKEIEGVRAKCIPRKPKISSSMKKHSSFSHNNQGSNSKRDDKEESPK